MTDQWRNRYLDHLIKELGVRQTKAYTMWLDREGNDHDDGYPPEWYAQEDYNCSLTNKE